VVVPVPSVTVVPVGVVPLVVVPVVVPVVMVVVPVVVGSVAMTCSFSSYAVRRPGRRDLSRLASWRRP
jgi:hypothetical protein